MFEPIDTNILYKYRADSEYTESIIKEHALWFSSPFAFNDPFDCWSVVKDATDEQKRQKIDEFTKKNMFVKYAAKQHPEVVSQNLQPSKLKICADRVLSQIRICSFSRNCDNILMWSHYAKEHTGMCFMFDFTEDPLFLKYCSKVNYVS